MIRLQFYRKLFSGLILRNPKAMTDKIVDVAEALSKMSSVTQLIRNGGVIALPTDTIYGVACSIDSAEALMRIQQLKGRSPNKPMAICVDKVSRIPHWCDTSGLPDGLLNDLLPGPVTVLLPRHSSNHCLDRPHLNPGVQMVGVRVPDHGFIQSLVSALSETEPNETTHGDCVSPGHPLVLTSANLSGNASALTIEEFSSIWPALDLIVDGGVISGTDANDSSPPSARSGSTIVDLTQASKQLFRITRDGSALESTVKTLEQNYGMRWLKPNHNSPDS
ncbi:YrdC domain-containing protein mitochondrial [Paragonimus heterotremus]|uniref:Threonylcarbamoyl-AMP synthase n=1 Tax=Paragonimus heterotremus TaxID=100268 RepID=A0A8J4TP43_9TREM|nr:YrdC domain-containing protein mitochondrial [Paragonimus heterotremus]